MKFLLTLDRYNLFLFGAIFISLIYNVLIDRPGKDAHTSYMARVFTAYEKISKKFQASSDEKGESVEAYSRIQKDGGVYRVLLEEGDSFGQVLSEINLDHKKSYLVSKAIDQIYRLNRLRAGEELQIVFQSREGAVKDSDADFERIIVDLMDAKIQVDYDHVRNSFKASLVPVHLIIKQSLISGKINNNFLKTAQVHGIPRTVAIDFIRIFSHEIDFERELGAGSKFKIMHEYQVNEKGKKIKEGKILYAALERSGKNLEIYRYDFNDGTFGYFNSDGVSIKKTLLKTPVKNSHISSGYGLRKHPILGYSIMHKGLDYAAPRGTPIVASGDGVIEAVRYHNTYGRYIKIKHNKRYNTLYAHIDRFAKNIAVGLKVKQGQEIGYVGSTGMSTGYHLHYEVHLDGKQINPAKVVAMKAAQRLTDQQIFSFRLHKNKVHKMIREKSYGINYYAMKA